jgi:hypothetical protein
MNVETVSAQHVAEDRQRQVQELAAESGEQGQRVPARFPWLS